MRPRAVGMLSRRYTSLRRSPSSFTPPLRYLISLIYAVTAFVAQVLPINALVAQCRQPAPNGCEMKLDQAATAVLENTGDLHSWRMGVPEAGDVVIQFIELPADYRLFVYAPDGSVWQSSDNQSVQIPAARPGLYEVNVDSPTFETSPHPYSLIATRLPSSTPQIEAVPAPVPQPQSASGGETSMSPTTTVVNNATVGADLFATLSGSPNPVLSGSQLSYTIVVTNGGLTASGATNLFVSVPAGVGNVAVGRSCTLAGGGITCTVPQLVPNATVQFSFSATVTAAPGAVINTTAIVDPGNVVSDDVRSNNVANMASPVR
jgi:hypothetical protein